MYKFLVLMSYFVVMAILEEAQSYPPVPLSTPTKCPPENELFSPKKPRLDFWAKLEGREPPKEEENTSQKSKVDDDEKITNLADLKKSHSY